MCQPPIPSLYLSTHPPPPQARPLTPEILPKPSPLPHDALLPLSISFPHHPLCYLPTTPPPIHPVPLTHSISLPTPSYPTHLTQGLATLRPEF
ncbi:hypothetical protein Pcinc_043095 [Petrolisthes cinctipes]|uniref:Uncharacterized protein n=1 Tax=Petrolisthes cinctipes TaxID=88211 RepID=A0AAE1EGE1_PETCI|nr:hypothetical protein Pcinc_043095 [Petrolisthes cinctipes]